MEIKELKFEELTTEQKLGLVMTGRLYNRWNPEKTEADIEYALNMIKEHKLGAIWVDPTYRCEEFMQRIREVADYPILIITDAECGLREHMPLIGHQYAISCCNTKEHAYAFGKMTAVTARKAGFNVICNPILDMIKGNCCCNMTLRSLGCDKYKVTEIASAEAQGMHDGGVLTVGKHYPSAEGDPLIDSHLAEDRSDVSREELIDYYLYPYLELNKRGLLDGIMTGHNCLAQIDPERPTTLSKKSIDVIRDLGFQGFAITDDLSMGGITTKYGAEACRSLAIGAGNDLALIWVANKDGYESLLKGYDEGLIPDDMLDAAVKRVLAAQHKVTLLNKDSEVSEKEMETFRNINKDSIIAKTDDGIPVALDKDGKHFFIIMCHNDDQLTKDGEIVPDMMTQNWYNPIEISKKVKEQFPNSGYIMMKEFPSNLWKTQFESKKYDDIVFVTFTSGGAYVGAENFAPRVISFFKALQVTNRVSTILHFGNPFVLEDLPHIGRVIAGSDSSEAVNSAIDILAGKYPAKGTFPYDIKLQ